MAHAYDVAALGSAIVDVLAPVDDTFLLTHNIAKGVMTLIDEHRAAQLYAALGNPREIAGGSAANTMAGLASLGGRGVFDGKVKHDRLGEAFAASMKDLGVHYTTKPARRRPADGDVPDRGDAGRRAQHEHLSRRGARAFDRTISTRRRSRRRRCSTSKAICGTRPRRRPPA